MNKKGYVDPEVFMHPAFVILLGIAWGATALGYISAKNMGWGTFPVWQFLVILLGELVACYIFVMREV